MNIINILQKKYKEKGATLEKLCCFKKNAGFDKKSINQMIDFAAYENNIDRTGKNIFGIPIAEIEKTKEKRLIENIIGWLTCDFAWINKYWDQDLVNKSIYMILKLIKFITTTKLLVGIDTALNFKIYQVHFSDSEVTKEKDEEGRKIYNNNKKSFFASGLLNLISRLFFPYYLLESRYVNMLVSIDFIKNRKPHEISINDNDIIFNHLDSSKKELYEYISNLGYTIKMKEKRKEFN